MIQSANHPFQFTTRQEARAEMTEFIRRRFSGLLGTKIHLLDLPNGLDLIEEEVHMRLAAHGIHMSGLRASA